MTHAPLTRPPLTEGIAILLAGGQSQRMGQDKSLLAWRGQPLWQKQRELCLAAGCARVLVSGDPARIPGALPDRESGLGPLGGLASALATLDEERRQQGKSTTRGWLLLLPVDLPLLDLATLQQLADNAGDARAAHFTHHPLPALLRDSATLRTALAATLATRQARERSLQALHRTLGARELPLPPGIDRALTNTNTPDDWLAAGGDPLP